MPSQATEPDGITSSRSQLIEAEIYRLGVGKKFVCCGFDNYVGEKSKQLVIDAADQAPLPWMYIFGPTGCGKTHLAIAIIRYLFESERIYKDGKARTVIFANVAEMLFDIRHTYDAGKFGDKEWDHMNKYNRADILIFDDLGAERQNDWAVDIIYRIIYHRYKEGLCTITTSNFDPGKIETIHGAPVASRLCSGEIIKIEMLDYRKKRIACQQ
jgi:DNA replication protein DnaC